MLGNSIIIENKEMKNHISIDIHNLRDTEQGILNYMLLSNANFLDIQNKLTEEDFTFLIHKIIFKHLVILAEVFLTDEFHGITDLNIKLNIFANYLNKEENIKIASILDILSQTPSMYIERDLEIINANSMEKEIAINTKGIENSVTIETKDGITWSKFIDGILISIGTSNIAKLPTELYDNFGDTLNALFSLDLENGDNEASMTFYGNLENSDAIESFYLKKDVAELKWFDNLCQWADKYDLDEDTFPRDRYKLQDLFELDISNKGITELPSEIGRLISLKILIVDNNNLKEFPIEIYKLKNLVFLSCMKNKILHISEEIINLHGLLMFAACHNEIFLLPHNFFRLKNLKSICLHDNKLTELSSEIGNLSKLTSITISNNDIKVLPQFISKLEKLESLDIENTQILEIPIDLLRHMKLTKLSINDALLPLVIQNMRYLNIDTINLTASDFQKSSQIIKDLDFRIDNEIWMEERDKKDNGCIVLSKYEDKE